MLLMFFFCLVVNQYIIYEYDDKLIQVLLKKPIHEVHKSCWVHLLGRDIAVEGLHGGGRSFGSDLGSAGGTSGETVPDGCG